MTEQYKRVSNPLTIIAIFAGLAEIAGTVAIRLVSSDLQHVFVWFVMGFPVLLVCLFFLTLNFNSTVLYAPSDFRDDESFLNVLAGKQRVIVDLESIDQRLEEAKQRIVEEAEKKVGAVGEKERRSITQIIDLELKRIQEKVTIAKESAAELSTDLSIAGLPNSRLQANILEVVRKSNGAISVSEICQETKMSVPAVRRALDRLVERGVIRLTGVGRSAAFEAVEPEEG
jgi:hypothetical protein